MRGEKRGIPQERNIYLLSYLQNNYEKDIINIQHRKIKGAGVIDPGYMQLSVIAFTMILQAQETARQYALEFLFETVGYANA
jgi:hypothetical protein